MAWNLPEQKPPGGVAAVLLQKLNCFEGGRFHFLRFAVLLAVALLAALVMHDLPAIRLSMQKAGLMQADSGELEK